MPMRHVVKTRSNRVQGLLPAYPRELVFPATASSFQREEEPVGGMNDVGGAAYPGAAHCVRPPLVGNGFDDPVAFDRNLNGAPGRAKSAMP